MGHPRPPDSPVKSPDYLRERAAHYRQMATLAQSAVLATWLRAVAASFLADAAEREAAARLAEELGETRPHYLG
jgi:hypothetical protein